MIASAKSKAWAVTYLLPYAAGPSATPDRKARGQFRHKEIITAPNSRDIVRDLVGRQAVPVEVKEIKPVHPLFGGKVSKEFKRQFLLSLTFSVDGGMSPGRALEQAIESQTGPMRQRLDVGLNALRQGRSFLDALRMVDIYDTTTMAIIEAGEETGTLRQALTTAEGHMKKGNDARKTIIGALAWTGIDLFFAVASIVSTRTGLIPYLREQNAGEGNKDTVAMGHALDLATTANDILIGFTIVAMIALFAGAYGYFSSNESWRAKVDAWLLRVPVVRDLMVHTAISGTCGVMSSLLTGGVNFIPATLITERGTRMMTVIRYWTTARNRVETGESPAAATNMEPFTSTERLILGSHKDSAQLAKAYQVIGATRDELAKSSAKSFARITFLVTMAYSFLGVVLVLFVVYLQNQSVMTTSFSGG